MIPVLFWFCLIQFIGYSSQNITCNDSNTCQSMIKRCDNNEACMFNCDTINSCKDTIFKCNNNGTSSCNINCNVDDSCVGTIINAKRDTNIHCSGNGCKNINVLCNSDMNNTCNIECNNRDSCNNIEFHCLGNSQCNILCNTNFACTGTIHTCSDTSECNMECNMPNSCQNGLLSCSMFNSICQCPTNCNNIAINIPNNINSINPTINTIPTDTPSQQPTIITDNPVTSLPINNPTSKFNSHSFGVIFNASYGVFTLFFGILSILGVYTSIRFQVTLNFFRVL